MPQGDTHNSVWWRSAADETLDLPLLAVQGVLGLGAGDNGGPCGDRRGCWHPVGLVGMGSVGGGLDGYWGPSLKGRDGETAPSPPVMENIEWRLWALLGFCKAPTKIPHLCTPIPGVKDPAPISLVSLASEKGCLLQKPSRIPSHLVFLFCALPDSLSNH